MNHLDYTKIPGINWSMLKLIARSPLHYRYRMDHPEEGAEKPAYLLGRAAHCAILEPDIFHERFMVWGGGRRYGKKWDAFRDEYSSFDILTTDEMGQVEAMSEAVFSSDAASLLTGGRAEVLLKWRDATTGELCKGRVDYITDTMIVDLKTTRDPSPQVFPRDVARYLYHGQLAFYHAGSGCPCLPAIVAVQSVPPYDVAVYQMTQEAMDAGSTLVQRLLSTLVACHAADLWPGVAPGVINLELPQWAAGNEDLDQADIDGLDWSE